MTRDEWMTGEKENKRKARMSTMPKAILELPKIPESCWQCPLQAISTEKKIRYCTVIRCTTDYYGTKRRADCPLKPVEKGGMSKMNDIFQVDYLPNALWIIR